MIIYADITNFTTWFVDQAVTIWISAVSKLQQINITAIGGYYVSLWEFILGIILLSVFIPILVNAPAKISIREKKVKKEKGNKNDK